MGNSEVGHLNLGAGAVVKQDLARIDDAVADGSFFENEALRACLRGRQGARGRLHLLGLSPTAASTPAGTTSRPASSSPPARGSRPRRPRLHRRPRHAAGLGRRLPRRARALARRARPDRHRQRPLLRDGPRPPLGADRVRLAGDRQRRGPRGEGAAEAVAASHERGETDEFVRPTVIAGYDGLAAGDAAIHMNFRPDRARQLTRALAEPGFEEFDRGDAPAPELTTMTLYQEGWPYPVAFAPSDPAVAYLFISAHQQSDKVSDKTRDALDDGGNMLHERQQHPACWGPTSRPGEAARPRRHDHADALRRRQGVAAVDPARHAGEHPRPRPGQDQRGLRVRRPGADDPDA